MYNTCITELSLRKLGFRIRAKIHTSVFRVERAGEEWVAKVVAKPKSGETPDPRFPLETKYAQLENEVRLLTGDGVLVGCPGVVTAVTEQTDSHLLLLQQPVGRSLADYCLPEDELAKEQLLRNWTTQAIKAIRLIRGQGVMHRDIKPNNIIIGSNNSLFIIDFGLSILTTDRLSSTVTNSMVGTPAYGSDNYEAKRPLEPYDDIESLCYTLHAVRIGLVPWLTTVVAGEKPSFTDLYNASSHVRLTCRLAGHEPESETKQGEGKLCLAVGVGIAAIGVCAMLSKICRLS